MMPLFTSLMIFIYQAQQVQDLQTIKWATTCMMGAEYTEMPGDNNLSSLNNTPLIAVNQSKYPRL